MTVQAYTPFRFGSLTINSGNISSRWHLDNGPIQSVRYDPIEASVPGLGDRDVRAQPKAVTWILRVRLAVASEDNVQTMLQTFSHDLGLQYLQATDGNAVTWRVQCRVLQVEQIPGSNDRFLVHLRVPDPRWQEQTATTDNTGLNKQTSPITQTVTNNGNRFARPTFTVTADAAKTGVTNDFGLSLQGYIVNRGPNDVVNKPVYLFDSNGAAGRINTSGVGLASGDDCRVWLDDVPDIPRWLVAWNTAASDVVINITLPAAVTMTLVAAQTSGSPANGASFTVNEDISRLPQAGFLVIDNEVIYFASRAGRTFYGIQRAQWGSTAASHILGSNVYANPRHYVVATSYSGVVASAYGPPPSPSAQRPCIQLPASNNQIWRWGDESDDANTVYYDRNNPDRTAQWVPGFDADGNTLSPAISLAPDSNGIAGGNILTFKDDVPGDGNPPYNFAEVTIPCGIIPVLGSQITSDWTPNAEELNLEMWVRDAGGNLKLVDQLQQSAAAPGRNQSALATVCYGVKLKARYNNATGYYTVPGFDASFGLAPANATDDPAAVQAAGQSFTLDVATYVRGWTIWIKQDATLTQNNKAGIFPDAGGKPQYSTDGSVANTAFMILGGTAILVTTGAGWQQLTWIAGPALLPAGKYHLVIWRSAPFTAAVNTLAGKINATYSKGRAEKVIGSAGNMTAFGGVCDFRILCDYDASGTAAISNDQPIRLADALPTTRTGLTASFDKTIIHLATSQGVKVSRMTAFTAGLFHLYGTLTNSTTGDTIAFDKWMALTSTLAVDCDQRTVTYTEAGVSYPVTKAITPSNTADWMACGPGSNSLSYADASLAAPGQMDLVTTYRGTKV